MKSYYVYILASKQNGALYTGVTNDLVRRVYEHKNNLIDGYTKKYNIHQLVYFEETKNIESAIMYEKKIKRWKCSWKIELIEKLNPKWQDLYYSITQIDPGSRPADSGVSSGMTSGVK